MNESAPSLREMRRESEHDALMVPIGAAVGEMAGRRTAASSKAGHIVAPVTPGSPTESLEPHFPGPSSARIMHSTIRRVDVLDAQASGPTNTKAGRYRKR